MRKYNFTRILSLLFIVTIFASCNLEYWWTRGQPPTPEKLFHNASLELLSSIQTNKFKRDELAKDAQSLLALAEQISKKGEKESTTANMDNSQVVKKIITILEGLEGKLSWGNRAPYGELIGQYRVARNSLEKNEYSSGGLVLLNARLIKFLNSELNLPSPVSSN